METTIVQVISGVTKMTGNTTNLAVEVQRFDKTVWQLCGWTSNGTNSAVPKTFPYIFMPTRTKLSIVTDSYMGNMYVSWQVIEYL